MIDGHALAERLRCRGSRSDLRISPLALRYLSPRTVPSFAIDGCKSQVRGAGTPEGEPCPSGPARTPTRLPRVGPKASTTPMPHSVDTSTFHGWTFSRQEDALSTLSFPGCQQRWAPVVDGVSAWREPGPLGVRSQCGRQKPLWPAMKQAFGRGRSHRQRRIWAQGHTAGG